MNAGLKAKLVSAALPRSAGIGEYVELMKLRLVSLVLVTTVVGFCVGYVGPHDAVFFGLLVRTVLGTALLAGGAMTLNQVLERDTDALMRRTRTRPLPEGRIAVKEATAFGVTLVALGAACLCLSAHWLAGLLGVVTVGVYLFLYTPLKTLTPLCTPVGAVSGAIPPMIGYTAAAGAITARAWLLFAILFAWQMPHFLAIAWMYRDDYAQGRQMMLPVVDPSGRSTARQMASFALVLLPVTLLAFALGMAGSVYFMGATGLGLAFLAFALGAAMWKTRRAARAMFIASVVYLPVLLGLLMMDRA